MRHVIGCIIAITLTVCGYCMASSSEKKTPLHPVREHLVMSDGEELALRVWLPEGEPHSVIIALHGINDYSLAFSLPAEYLTARGIAVYAYDQRGHGSSPQRGRWQGAGVLAGDVRDAIRLIGNRHQGLPVYMLGESMGGAVAIIALTGESAPEVAGLILVAPAVRGGIHFNRFYRAVLAMGARVMPYLSFSARWSRVTLSDSEDAVSDMRSDPLVVHKSRLDTLGGVVDLMDSALEAASKLDCPVLILYGMRDEVVPKDAICDFLARLREKPVVVFYPEGYHLLLRDRQRETVLRDMVSWMKDRAEPMPSGLTHECE